MSAADEVGNVSIYERRYEELLVNITAGLRECGNILEFGCGDCELSVVLARRLRVPVLGLDLGDHGFAQALEKARKHRVRRLVNCTQGDAERLEAIPDRAYTCAVSKWVLHELDHPIRALREIRRVLMPGGLVVCCDFTKGSEASTRWAERYYTPAQAEALLRRAGFVRVRAKTILDGHAMIVQGRRRRSRGSTR